MKNYLPFLTVIFLFLNCYGINNTSEVWEVEGYVEHAEYDPIVKENLITLEKKTVTVYWDKNKISGAMSSDASVLAEGIIYCSVKWQFVSFPINPDSIIKKNIKIHYMNIDPTKGLFLALDVEVEKKSDNKIH